MNIGVYLFDNSDGEETRELVKDYLSKNSNLHYYKSERVLSYGENTYKAFLFPQAEYLLVIGDSIIVRDNYYKDLIDLLKKEKPTCLILNNRVKKYRKITYTDPQKFCRELAWHCTLTGATIMNYKLIKKCEERNIIKKYIKSDFIHLGILLEGILLVENLKIVFNPDYVLTTEYIKIKKISSWRNRAFEVFGNNWINFVENLPKDYSSIKEKIILDHGVKSGLFTFKGLLYLRYEGFFTKEDIKKYKNIFSKITNLNLILIKFIAFIPRKVIVLIVNIIKEIKKLSRGRIKC